MQFHLPLLSFPHSTNNHDFRSIIIRWVMQKLNREQNAANSNLYVVQWRWGLQSEGESMTEWQTVTVVSSIHRQNRLESPNDFLFSAVSHTQF